MIRKLLIGLVPADQFYLSVGGIGRAGLADEGQTGIHAVGVGGVGRDDKFADDLAAQTIGLAGYDPVRVNLPDQLSEGIVVILRADAINGYGIQVSGIRIIEVACGNRSFGIERLGLTNDPSSVVIDVFRNLSACRGIRVGLLFEQPPPLRFGSIILVLRHAASGIDMFFQLPLAGIPSQLLIVIPFPKRIGFGVGILDIGLNQIAVLIELNIRPFAVGR